MPRYFHFVAALLTLALALPIAPANPPTRPASQPADSRWQSLLQALGDNDFATRESAQKELDTSTWHDLPQLRTLADSATDPEVKARLTARVAAIEEDLLVNPPGLTVYFMYAGVMFFADKLSAALGIKLDVWPPNGRAPDIFTLSAREKPFWEIVLDLSRQHPLMVQDINGAPRLYSQNSGWRNGVISGPVAVFPQSITRQRSASFQGQQGTELSAETLNLNCQMAIDPRLHVLKYSNPIFTTVIDDAGNNLLAPQNNNASLFDTNSRSMTVQSISTPLLIPEKKGTRIVSAKGSVHFLLQTAEEHLEVADVGKKEGQSFDIAGHSIKLDRFSAQADNSNISMSLVLTRPPNVPAADVNAQPAIAVSLLDATGRTLMSATLRDNMGSGIGGTFTPPLKLRLSIPTKTKDVTFPFELKDLPLP